MISLAELERYVHGRCGMPLDDVLDAEFDSDPQMGRRARYFTPKTPRVCHYCAARDDQIHAYREANPNNMHPAAQIWPVYDRGRDR